MLALAHGVLTLRIWWDTQIMARCRPLIPQKGTNLELEIALHAEKNVVQTISAKPEPCYLNVTRPLCFRARSRFVNRPLHNKKAPNLCG